jgi:CRISPR system Cascade subunit CasE
MMYLSRIKLNYKRQETKYLLASPQRLHAALAASFPTDGHGSDKRALWRMDNLGNSLYIIMQSLQRPDFTHIVEKYGCPGEKQEWLTKEYEPFLARLKAGQAWRFRLRANPVKSVLKARAEREGGMEKGRGKISPCVGVENQKKWLHEKSVRHGFRLLPEGDELRNLTIMQPEIKEFGRFDPASRESKKVMLSIVTFEGALLIEDREKFTAAMVNGIGRAKAYGCGLMTLARLP